jgi:hypothetical protein
MEIFSRFLVPAEAGIPVKIGAHKHKKPRISRLEMAASASVKPQRLNALIALRDGANCSETLW